MHRQTGRPASDQAQLFHPMTTHTFIGLTGSHLGHIGLLEGVYRKAGCVFVRWGLATSVALPGVSSDLRLLGARARRDGNIRRTAQVGSELQWA